MKTKRTAIIAATTAACITLAGCASPKPEPGPRDQANRFDLDGDGFLTRDEYSASALSDAMDFDALDADSDGLLSRRELEFRAGGGTPGRGSRGGKRPKS